ncbi:nucleotidyl transferase [Stanieria sp. NIES-3757]|nr:nucleotidyl transferase [Stanieria sp. NIES-3757]
MSQQKVRKALIPAAGFGTRLFPATKIVKKELFPIIDGDGRAKPIIIAIVEEAINAGIEQVGIVVQPEDQELFTDLFKAPPKPELFKKLSLENQEYSQYLQDLGKQITILIQTEQEGYGHAVYCAKDWVEQEPFLLLLGDHVYTTNTDRSCAKQMLDVYQQFEQNIIGLTIMSAEIIHKAGCVTGVWQQSNSLLEITEIYEKPSLEYARKNLKVNGMKEDEFLGVFGMYILESKIFDLLAEDINNNYRFKGEFQLTTCLDKLRQQQDALGYLVQGQYFDTGMPLFYRQTMIDFYQAHQN